MRILHLTGDREDAGGILSVLRNLQEATRHWGWDHSVWVSSTYAETRAPSLQYVRSRSLVTESPSTATMLARAVRAIPEVRALLEQHRYDLLHAHSRVGFAIACALAPCVRQAVIFTNHAYARRRWLYQRAAKLPGMHTVVLTPAMATYYGLRPDDQRVSVVSCCCADALLATPLAPRRATPPSVHAPLRLRGLGHVIPSKGWHLVLEALRDLAPNERELFEFSLFGSSTDRKAKHYAARLERLAREYGLEQQFFLRGMTHAVHEVLRQTDWLVHPMEHEGCGVAILEALALGVPVLASESGGPKDLLAGCGRAAFFRAGSSESLALALKDILHGRRSALPAASLRAIAAGRSATAMAASYRRVYERALARRAQAGE